MKRPAFQFYPADWRNNAKLRRCSEAARGAWMDVLCVLHDSDEYGVCRWPLADLARSAGVPAKLLKELVDKGVLKGSDKLAEAFVFVPRHAGKDGQPVTLVEPVAGPCWYCSRFVRDEYVRQKRGASTRFDADNQPPKAAPEQAPKASPKVGIGERHGDGASSTSTKEQELPATPEQKTLVDDPLKLMIDGAVAYMGECGVAPQQARSVIGLVRKTVGDELVASEILASMQQLRIAAPVSWLRRSAESRKSQSGNTNGNRTPRIASGVNGQVQQAINDRLERERRSAPLEGAIVSIDPR